MITWETMIFMSLLLSRRVEGACANKICFNLNLLDWRKNCQTNSHNWNLNMAIIPKQCNINENNGMNVSKWNNLRKNINGQVHPLTVDSRLSIQIPQKFPG